MTCKKFCQTNPWISPLLHWAPLPACYDLPTLPVAPNLLILGDSTAPCMKHSEMAPGSLWPTVFLSLHPGWPWALPCVGPAGSGGPGPKTVQSWTEACSPEGPACGCCCTPIPQKAYDRKWQKLLRTKSNFSGRPAGRPTSLCLHESLFPSSVSDYRWL